MKLENYWYFLFLSLICHMFKYFISLQTYKLLHEVQHLYQYRKIKDKKTMAMNGIIIVVVYLFGNSVVTHLV